MKLGLTQRHVALILGLRSSKRISQMERGLSLPTYRDCVALNVLFKRSFQELWPNLHFEIETSTDLKIRRLIETLEKKGRSERRRAQNKIICKNLAIIIDGLPEDIANLT